MATGKTFDPELDAFLQFELEMVTLSQDVSAGADLERSTLNAVAPCVLRHDDRRVHP